MQKYILFFSLLFTFSFQSMAEEVFTVIVKKQEEKQKTRWTLEEWLKTRDRIRLMDLWLYMHSGSPYEFYISPEILGYKQNNKNYNYYALKFAAYAHFAGIETAYDKNTEGKSSWLGALNLRLIGPHMQSTNLTLRYGIRSFRDDIIYRNQFADIDLTVYVFKKLGFEGLYRYFLKYTNDSGASLSGSSASLELFIDFSFLRIFGKYSIENLKYNIPGPTGNAASTNITNALGAGLKLYF